MWPLTSLALRYSVLTLALLQLVTANPTADGITIDLEPVRAIELTPPASIHRIVVESARASIEIGVADVLASLDRQISALKADGRTPRHLSVVRERVATAGGSVLRDPGCVAALCVPPCIIADVLETGRATVLDKRSGRYLARIARTRASWFKGDTDWEISRGFTTANERYLRRTEQSLFESRDQWMHAETDLVI